jgi:hypothetical protein
MENRRMSMLSQTSGSVNESGETPSLRKRSCSSSSWIKLTRSKASGSCEADTLVGSGAIGDSRAPSLSNASTGANFAFLQCQNKEGTETSQGLTSSRGSLPSASLPASSWFKVECDWVLTAPSQPLKGLGSEEFSTKICGALDGTECSDIVSSSRSLDGQRNSHDFRKIQNEV